MISIGAVYRGPELKGSSIERLIVAASKVIKELRPPLGEGNVPWVNAVFVVEGSLGAPSFRHLEFGDYSKKNHGVVVQIPVTRDEVERGDSLDFLVDSLRGANAMAFEFFQAKGQAFPLRAAEEIVTKVRHRLWKPKVV